MLKAEINWVKNRRFVALGESSGHAIVLDTPERSGGENLGIRPTEAFLIGIAGCTAVDVVNILSKMRVELSLCEVTIEADQQEDYPKFFNYGKIIYTLSGKNLDQEKAKKAVELSMDKYCAVSQTVKDRMKIETEIKIV
jgi:putative redox protein